MKRAPAEPVGVAFLADLAAGRAPAAAALSAWGAPVGAGVHGAVEVVAVAPVGGHDEVLGVGRTEGSNFWLAASWTDRDFSADASALRWPMQTFIALGPRSPYDNSVAAMFAQSLLRPQLASPLLRSAPALRTALPAIATRASSSVPTVTTSRARRFPTGKQTYCRRCTQPESPPRTRAINFLTPAPTSLNPLLFRFFDDESLVAPGALRRAARGSHLQLHDDGGARFSARPLARLLVVKFLSAMNPAADVLALALPRGRTSPRSSRATA